MARDTAQEKRDNINQGIPAHSGLDDATRDKLRRAADGGNDGIAVNSFADLQRGTISADPTEGPLNPNQDPSGIVSVRTDDPLMGGTPGGAAASDAGSDGGFDDTYSKAELQDALDERGIDYTTSDTKDDLLKKLNG